MKWKLFFMVFILFTSLLFTSCAARINEIMKSWEGRHVNDLIANWGPPTQIIDDGVGGKIFIYSETRTYTSSGHAPTIYGRMGSYLNADTEWEPPQTTSYKVHRMFWVDRNGYIYRWAWKGL